MKQRKKARSPRRPVHLKRPPTPGAWSLSLVDSSSIREKARKEYERVVRELEKAKVEIERFHAEDQPRYAKWLNSHFGALLTETRELQHKLFELQGLVTEVQQEFYFGNHRSIHKAYQVVLHRRAHPEVYEAEAREAEEADEIDDELAREFERVFGESKKEIFEQIFGFGGMDSEDQPGAPEAPAAPGTSRLKDLYRSLVRKLHPDLAGARSARQMEWWHQTQAAYQAQDIAQLELIQTMADIDEKGTKEASVSILQQIILQFKAGLNALRRELRHHRRDVAWNFSRRESFELLTQETREMLQQEKEKISAMLLKFQAQISAWEALGHARPAQSRPRGRQRTRAGEMDPWF